MPTCVSCGKDNPAGFRFCGACGAPVGDAGAADVRKTVTIVFCDMVGSTALGERSDPEVLREVMRHYHAALRTVLERHGGAVEKFVGDAAMAVFGMPKVHEDDPLRAVHAAVEMREVVRGLALDVRIGVNTGEVVSGRGETLVTGDAVNVAARLEQAAHAGEILIGEATAELVGAAVRSEPVEPLTLKGKREPVRAFRVLELVAGAPTFVRATSTPFVGREAELAQLERALSTAVERRSPQLATIVGPSGIGKSRLMRELLARSRARVLLGRCLSYGEGITYWPLSEIAAQIGDVRAGFGAAGDADLAAARVGAALGAPGATASPEEIAWGFRKLFESLARESPLIVVLDDIHWAEPTLLDLLEYVAAFAQGVPLFLLCTARPELLERRPAWASPRPNALVLTLEPLGAEETSLLVQELGALSPERATRIAEAAEGNPLFVEQLVAMQREHGDDALAIPLTLQALLGARLDGLASGERAVLERGSVEGRVFHRGSVAQLLPASDRPGVGAQLLTLVRKALIRPDQATIPGDDGYRFGHVLIRDAAYEAMPKRRRGELHAQFADWLIARLGDSAPAEIVGYHLERAYQYQAELGTVAPALGTRAAERLDAAARAARAHGDFAAATNLFRRASTLVPDGHPLQRTLLIGYGEALFKRGEFAAASEVLERAAALAREANDARAEWRARLALAAVRLWREPEGAAQNALAEARAAIAAVGPDDHEVLARAWDLIGDAALLRSQMAERARATDEALRHAREAGDRELEVDIVVRSAPAILFGETSVADGMRYVDGVMARLGDVPGVQAFGLHVLGHLRARLGEFEPARDAISAWREHLRELGREMQYANTAGCAWDVLALAGDWVGGERALREGCEILERMGDKASRSTQAAYLGVACFHQGRLDEAEHWANVSAELGASDDTMNEATWRALRARVLAARGQSAEAMSLAHSAVEHADRTDSPDLRADARLDLAEVLGGGADAERAMAEALALYERKGNRVGAARAAALRASVSRRQ